MVEICTVLAAVITWYLVPLLKNKLEKELNIVQARYLSRAQDATGMPIAITLERDDGVKYTYKR